MKGAEPRGSLVSTQLREALKPLSRRLSFAVTGERAHLIARTLFHVGELEIGLLQLQTALTALFVVSLPGQPGTRRSLSSETI